MTTITQTDTPYSGDDLLILYAYGLILADPELADEVPVTRMNFGPYRSRRKNSNRPPAASRTNTRPRTRRSPRRGTIKTAQDPGDSDGDPDPDHDPVGEAIERLLDSAPPFSVGQVALLGRILGGVR
jgi:hypothetical protein